MRAGTWPDTPVRSSSVQAYVNGLQLDVDELSLTSEMTADLEIVGGAGDPVTDGTITWPQRSVVADTVPQPFDRTVASWPPTTGVSMVAEVGDGDGQWWRQITGRIDSSSGSISSPQVQSRLVDYVDRMAAQLQHDPLLAIMPPLEQTDAYRRVGLLGTYVSDLAARRARFFATPPATLTTRFSVPCMGSLWPEIGSVSLASAFDDANRGPSWQRTSWGVAALNMNAVWSFTTLTDALVLTACLTDQAAGNSVAFRVLNTASDVGVVLRHSSADNITIASLLPAETALIAVPRNGATRVAVSVSRDPATATLSVEMRFDDGRVFTATTGYGSPIVFGRALLSGSGAIGGLLVDAISAGFAALTTTATAVFRVGGLQWLSAMPTLTGGTVLSLLTAQAKAQAASLWIDSAGRLHWVDRGLLEADPSVLTKTTDLTVDGLAWADNLESIRDQVTVNRRTPAISVSYRPNLILAGDLQAQTLDSGQTVETWIDPGADVDWVMPALNLLPLAVASRGNSAAALSYFGASVVADTDTDDTEDWAAAYTQHAATLAKVGASYKLTQTAGTVPAGRTLVTKVPGDATNVPKWLRGRALPLVRGSGLVVWADQSDSVSTGASGIAVYQHDVSWFVQDPDRLAELTAWIVAAVAAPHPTVTSVDIDPDPRLELGDKVTVTDPTRTGLELDLVVTRIQQAWGAGAPTMTLSGRVTRITRIATPTDPASAWDALLTGWKAS